MARKKKNGIRMARTKPLSQALSIDTYKDDKSVTLRLATDADEAELPEPVEVPQSIIRRIHHLGRAFDGQAVKYLKPQGKVLVDWLWIQRLIDELELVEKTTIDPVSQHYLSQIIPMLTVSRSIKNSVLLISADF